MYIKREQYLNLKEELQNHGVVLVAVSKIHPVEAIKELYDLGQRDFGENYVQELIAKQQQLPADIRWHFIGHLQSNKVKYIAPFVHLIHGVDSYRLLKEINKQGVKQGRKIAVLLQVHIAAEETKFGLDESELKEIMEGEKKLPMPGIEMKGLMGMASFSEDLNLVRNEFRILKNLYDRYIEQTQHSILSMGMSGDYRLALEEGSTMVRIGSLIFGARI